MKKKEKRKKKGKKGKKNKEKKKQEKKEENKKKRGLSVYYLKHILLRDIVEIHKLKPTLKIYELEDLHNHDEYGIICQKGQNVRCPYDGQMGAAFVDSIEEEDYVGDANIMLSYTWGYTMEDIVHTLDEYCTSRNLNPKQMYVYICCLCVNQFRVRERIRNGMDVPFLQFENEFRNCVMGIGHVLAMMQPWHKSTYLERVWCIFELFTASVDANCKLEIIMPQREKEAMIRTLNVHSGDDDTTNAVDIVSKVLVATKVEEAKAFLDTDKINIINMIKSHYGGCHAFDNEVNRLIRNWLKESLLEAIDSYELSSSHNDDDSSKNKEEELAKMCLNFGYLINTSLGDREKAIELVEKALDISMNNRNEDNNTNFVAKCYFEYGRILSDARKYDDAIESLKKAIEICETNILKNEEEEETQKTLGNAYSRLGYIYSCKGQYDDALQNSKRSLDIRRNILKENHSDIAKSYNNIALALCRMGNLEGALINYELSMKIATIAYNTKEHPFVATVTSNIGGIYRRQKLYDKAIEYFKMTLNIRQKLLGDDNVSTALTYHNLGQTMYEKGEENKYDEEVYDEEVYDEALDYFTKALQIYEKLFGEDDKRTVRTQNWIYRTAKIMNEERG